MLEPILKGLVEWLYEMMIDIMSYASGELLGVMSMDLSYFERTAPIISDIVNVFIALGWALLIGNLVFQSLKAMMSGAGFEAEDPKILFLRTFVFSFLLLASRQICDLCSGITGTVITMLDLPDSITVTTPNESMFTLAGGAKWLLVIIVGVVLMLQMVKLLFEIGERYVITSVLTFFAPLAFAMGGSKNTNDIFKGWCRMYGSMLVMMIMNIVFLKLIMSAMSQMTSGGVLIWLVFVVALTRVARKIDSHIGKIGLNPAQTGNAIGSRLPGVMTMVAVRSMGSLVSKSMANAKGGLGGQGGKSGRNGGTTGHSHNPNMGGPRPGGSSGGNTYNGGSNTSGANVNTGGTRTNVGGVNAGGANVGGGNTGDSKTTANQGIGTPSSRPIRTSKGNAGTVNQGVRNTNQQGAVHENVQDIGRTQRPPIPRGTGGIYPHGASPMSSVVNGGQTHVDKTETHPNNAEVHKTGQTTKGVTPNVSVASGSRVNRNTSGTVNEDGYTTVSTPTTVHNNSEVRKSNVKGENVAGVSVSGKNVSGMNIGGNNAAGNNVGGDTHTSTGNTHIHNSQEKQSEHITERHSKNMQIQTEVRKSHEYKHGRYNPAASNKKVKKTYYQKDNPRGYRQNRDSGVKRGGNNRTSKPKQ